MDSTVPGGEGEGGGGGGGGGGGALFEWSDGVVVKAMKEGGSVLVDEISLADDAVLERLNSVLEPDRKLLVAERGRHKDRVSSP